MLLITGGAGFIGGNFVHHWFEQHAEPVVVLDKLTYAGNARTIAPFLQSGQCELVQGDICDAALVTRLLGEHRVYRDTLARLHALRQADPALRMVPSHCRQWRPAAPAAADG